MYLAFGTATVDQSHIQQIIFRWSEIDLRQQDAYEYVAYEYYYTIYMRTYSYVHAMQFLSKL